jgi:hypothetical protein
MHGGHELDSCTHTAGPNIWLEERLAGLNSLGGQKLIAVIPTASSAHVSLAGIGAAQPGCTEMVQLQPTSSLHIVPQRIAGVVLLCDTSQGPPRPVAPASHQRQIFAAMHGMAHPGLRATRLLVASRFAWKGMRAEIVAWIRDC